MRIAALALALLPGAAAALSPPPACFWDGAAQQSFADAGIAVWTHRAENRFAVSTWSAPEEWDWGLLHHCPTGQYLLFTTPSWAREPVFDRFDALVETSVPVTMRQIGEDLAGLGAEVRMGQGDIGRCDCEMLGL